jgi:hypothetical protein
VLIYHEDNYIVDFFKIFENYSNIEILQSIKITKKSFNKDRYDINIPTYKISLDSLFKILNTLNFPNDKFQEIVKEYNQSEEVHFGIEKNKKQINYRVYFKRKISLSEWLSYKNSYEQTTVFYSFKWNSENNSNVLNTSYDICHNVDAKKMIEIIKTKISFLPKFLVKKIKEKSNHKPKHLIRKSNLIYSSQEHPYVLFSVEDKNSPRKSFNIIHEPIVFWGLSSDIEKFFDIKFSEVFADLQNECFINFTGGIDKNNEDFITLYFELNKGS